MWTVCTSGAVGKAAASAGHDCRGFTRLRPEERPPSEVVISFCLEESARAISYSQPDSLPGRRRDQATFEEQEVEDAAP